MALTDETNTVPTQPRAYSATRTWIWITIVLFLLAAAVLPSLININRYQHRIARIVSASIGRPVYMSAVKLRLLPRPGFEISGFVVDEDPAFGAEPMLRAPSVVASVRLLSMWRGRLEIARIHFDEPSLNLVRRSDGQWNFGSVLLKASATPNAPTAQRHVSGSPRFPYIEATNARINFKAGDEKKPFSFLNADLSVWLDNPDEWRLRFEAQPVRTDLDLDLADTGILKISGSVKRAAALSQVPLMLHAEWTKAPLGQLSRMVAGRDAGWRGDLEMRADISGTGEDALLKTQLKATTVHRIEFAPAEPMDLDANCQGRYVRSSHSLEGLACTSPVGKGHLLLKGAVRQVQQAGAVALDLQMQKVPVSAALGLARSVREGFAPSLEAVGSIDGSFEYSSEASGPGRLKGGATVSALDLSAPLLDQSLLLPPLRLVASGEETAAEYGGNGRSAKLHKQAALSLRGVEHPSPRTRASARDRAFDAAGDRNSEATLLLVPFAFPAGGPSPLAVDGRFTSQGYEMHVAGTANVKTLAAYGKALGLLRHTLGQLEPVGSAELDLRTRGAWLKPVIVSDGSASGERLAAAASTEGQLQLRNARVATGYLAAPVDILSAHATFKGSEAAWDSVSLNYGQHHADGALQYSRPCLATPDCAATFRLKFAALDLAAAQSTLLGGGRTQFFGELLAKLDHRPHPWPALRGTMEAATLTLGQLSIHDARAVVAISGNQVAIQSFEGRTLGGGLHLTGSIDASGRLPIYALDAAFAKVSTSEVAALFREKWGTGQITGETHLQLAGYQSGDLISSATGNFRWDWTQGSLPAAQLSAPPAKLSDPVVQLSGPPPESSALLGALSHFQRWSAEGTIAAGKLSLTNGTLFPDHGSAEGAESTLGDISFQRELNLVLGPRAGLAPVKSKGAASLRGTLAQPLLQVNPAPSPSLKNEAMASQVLTR